MQGEWRSTGIGKQNRHQPPGPMHLLWQRRRRWNVLGPKAPWRLRDGRLNPRMPKTGPMGEMGTDKNHQNQYNVIALTNKTSQGPGPYSLTLWLLQCS